MATGNSVPLKLYTNDLSPVCRAVMYLLEVEQIPYEERTIRFRNIVQLLARSVRSIEVYLLLDLL